MSFLQRLFPDRKQRAALAPLYAAIVAEGRDPFWYREGQVPDTIDGRFDMIAAVTALVLLRLEAEGEAGRGPAILLTETFIDDMDATLRQIGIGDYVVGKHVGRMMSGARRPARRLSRCARIGILCRRRPAQHLPRIAAVRSGARSGRRRGSSASPKASTPPASKA